MSGAHPQKIKKAINRLQKALEACSEAQLQLKQVSCATLQKGDYVVLGGRLDRIVATQPGSSGVVALESTGEITQLPASDEYLVLRDG